MIDKYAVFLEAPDFSRDVVYQKDQSARHAVFRLDKIAGYTMKQD